MARPPQDPASHTPAPPRSSKRTRPGATTGPGEWLLRSFLKPGLRCDREIEPGGHGKGSRGLAGASLPHSTGRSSNETQDHRGGWACGRGRVEEGVGGTRLSQAREADQGGRGTEGLSALWYGEGRGWGYTSACPSSVRPSALPASGWAQSFQSFLMVRFHSQDRWSVLSSSVKRDLML